MDIGTAVAYLKLDLTAFNAGIETASGVMDQFVDAAQGKVESLGSIFTNVGVAAENLGNSLTQSLTVPLVNFGESAIDAYRSYESAFTGVKKTLGVTDNAMEAFGGDMDRIYASIDEAIQGLASSTASSAEDIAAVMEAAGQLGVQFDENGKGLVDFTEVMVKLGDTTNLSADEAATALAKFMNVTGTAMEDVDKLGSVIVDLGNNFATDEASIVRMATRLASAGAVAGLTERDILALSTAMSSVGINAEAGGSSMAQTLAQIEKIVQKAIGGDEGAIAMLERLGEVSGLGAELFAEAWRLDPMQALTEFLLGMGRLEEQGESAVLVLDELGMSGIRQSNMLKALGLAGDVLSDAIKTSNAAWVNNNALSKEAELRYGTLDSQMSQLNEEWKAMQRDIAELLLPILQDLVGMLRDLIDWWNGLSDETKEAIVQIGEIAVVVGPALMIFGKLFSGIGLIIGAFEKIVSIGPATAQFLGLVGGGIVDVGEKASSFGGLIKGAVAAVGGFLSKVIEVVGGVMKAVGPVAMIIGGAITAVLSFIDIVKNGASVLNEIMLGVGLALAAVGAVIMGAPALVAGVVAGVVFVVANAVAWIIRHWDEIVAAVKAGWEKIKEVFNKFIEGIQDLAAKFGEWISDMFSRFWNFITDIAKNVAKWIADVTKSVIDFFSDILKKFAKWVADVTKKVIDFFADILKKAAKWIADVTKKVIDFFVDILKKVAEWIADVTKKVIDFFVKIAQDFAKWVADITKNVIDFFADLISKAVSFFGDIISKVFEFFGDIISKLVGFISDVFGKIGEFFNTIFSFIGDALSWIWERVIGFFGDLIRGFLAFVSETFQNLWNFAENVFNWLGEGLSGIWNSIVDWFSGLFDFFGDLPKKFFEIGKSIFSGLWDGLKFIWDKLTGWISDGVQWLANKIDKILPGFSSGNMFKNLFGSHAAGLDYVPFDGYMAQLHEGERVLTKQEAREYNRGEAAGSKGDTFNFYNTKPDPYEYARQMKRAKRELEFG